MNRISSTPVEIVVTGGESSKRIDVFLANRDPTFSRLSHGESFLALLSTRRFRGPGLFVMDEPEAGLAFEAQLALLGQLIGLASRRGCQVLLATHSPIIAALLAPEADRLRRPIPDIVRIMGSLVLASVHPVDALSPASTPEDLVDLLLHGVLADGPTRHVSATHASSTDETPLTVPLREGPASCSAHAAYLDR